MEFKQCDTFKCLRSEGKKGIYFIVEGTWVHLSLCRLGSLAPIMVTPGTYNSIEDAIKDAEEIDEAEDE